MEQDVELCNNIWEPFCGQGHLSKQLVSRGFEVYSTDLIDRGYGRGGVDFFKQKDIWDGDILTNPAYSVAKDAVLHSLDIITPGHNVYMFLKLQFLEGKGRKELFDRGELKTVYVSRSRIICAKNAEFEKVTSSAVAYAWFHFQKGYKGDPIIKWIN